MNSFWRYCLSHFEKELPAQQFVTWIKPLKSYAEGDTLTLIAPNRFVLQWIRDKFFSRIQELAEEQLNSVGRLGERLAARRHRAQQHRVRGDVGRADYPDQRQQRNGDGHTPPANDARQSGA